MYSEPGKHPIFVKIPLSCVLNSTKQPGLNIVESMYFVPKRRRRRRRRSFS
jgi:hypothetical protein